MNEARKTSQAVYRKREHLTFYPGFMHTAGIPADPNSCFMRAPTTLDLI
jgi:hypothetical protein